MRMRTFKPVLVQVFLLGLSLPALAQSSAQTIAQHATTGTVVTMPNPATRPADVDTPPRGLTMARVIERYGAPLRRHAPVGQPPITRWDYPGYHLYFEGNRVLHAVAPSHPVPVAHQADLIGGTAE